MPAATPTSSAEALLAVQKEISKIDFPKTAKNPHFGSNYCPLDVILARALPVLNAHGFVLTQEVTTIDGADGTQGALKTTLLYTVPTGNAPTLDRIESTMLLMPLKPNPQNQGSAITYARRYAVQTLLAIVPEDDVDGTQTGAHRQSSSSSEVQPEAAAFDAAGPSPI